MKKLESSFLNMVVVLFAVSLIVSIAVGYVYTLTKDPIEVAKALKQQKAIRSVIDGDFDNDPNADSWSVKMSDDRELVFYPAKRGGELIGTAVKTYTTKGFSGFVSIMVGFKPDGSVFNYSVLEHKETPGLGSKMSIWFLKDGKGSIIGKIPSTKALAVSKDGGDVDAITAATISSRAFVDAINRAAMALTNSNK